MGFWLDLISGRRYLSPYEPLRDLPPDELAEFDDGDEAAPYGRPGGCEERSDANVEAGSAA
jgi:hypothetical protein